MADVSAAPTSRPLAKAAVTGQLAQKPLEQGEAYDEQKHEPPVPALHMPVSVCSICDGVGYANPLCRIIGIENSR